MQRRLAAAALVVAALLGATSAAAVRAPAPETRVDLPDRPTPEPIPLAPAALAALAAESGGRWTAVWDPWTGTAVRGQGGGRALGPRVEGAAVVAAAEAFRDRHAAVLGARGLELGRVRCEHLGRAWHVTWQQKDGGRPVVGCILDLTLREDGVVVAFVSTIVPGLVSPSVHIAVEPARRACAALLAADLVVMESEPVVVPWPEAGRYRARPALELRLGGSGGGRWRALVDAGTGGVLGLESLLRYERLEGVATGDVHPHYAQEMPETRPLAWLGLSLRAPAIDLYTTADGAGRYVLETPAAGTYSLHAGLEGPYVYVTNAAGDPQAAFLDSVQVPGTAPVHFGAAEARADERTIYYHANVVHDYARERFGFALLDYPMHAVAAVHDPNNGDPNYANAFWDGEGINFGNGGASYRNFGLFADVIYHEYVHGITDFMYRPGGGLGGPKGGAIHEALSDYFACTLTDEPLVGEYVGGGPGAFRNLDNNLRWPDDAAGEVHRDGEILAGALWDVRRALGADAADAIVHFARTTFPRTFEDYLTAMILQDDLLYGDGAPANGSPHLEAILAAFGRHGIGSAAGAPFRIVHQPLGDTEVAGEPRTVRARLEAGGLVVGDSLRLYYATDGLFLVQRMHRQPDASFAADIPGQPLGTQVRYYLAVIGSRGRTTRTDPARAPDSTYAYRVGPDLEPPRITYSGPESVAAFTWPPPLVARIDDNLGVRYAYVEYQRNGVPSGWLGMVPATDDPWRYTAQFTGPGAPGDVFEYWLVAVDAARAANSRRYPASGTLRFQIVDRLVERVENGPGSWTHGAVLPLRPDPWHVSATDNHTPAGTHSWFCGLEQGEYPASTAAALVTDPYALANGAEARFWSHMDAENNGANEAFDGGVVQLRVEGQQDWEMLAPAGGYTHVMTETGGTNVLARGTPCLSGHDPGWRELRFDLGAFAGQSVRLRFLFGSDNVASPFGLRGWAVDDFSLDPGAKDPTAAEEAGWPGRAGLLRAAPAPNPFNPRLAFDLWVPVAAGRVRLDIFDARGERVQTLVDAPLPPGRRRLMWDGARAGGLAAASGVYYYRLQSALGVERGRAVLLR